MRLLITIISVVRFGAPTFGHFLDRPKTIHYYNYTIPDMATQNYKSNHPLASKLRRTRRSMQHQPLGDKDLSTQRVPGVPAPPQNVFNPPITKRVRFVQPYAGTAYTLEITPLALGLQDAGDYFISVARYLTVRLDRVEAWFGSDSPLSSVPLVLEDMISQVSYQDSLSVGVDWAHVAMRPCLQSRMTLSPITATTQLAAITIPVLTGATGTVIVDCTATFN